MASAVVSGDSVVLAWKNSIVHLLGQPEHTRFNLIVDIAAPTSYSDSERNTLNAMDEALREADHAGVFTVANTIFPAQLYRTRGVEGVFTHYPEVVFPKVAKCRDNWWGTYAHRILRRTTDSNEVINPLDRVIKKIKRQLKSPPPPRSHYELNVTAPNLVSMPELEIGVEDPILKGDSKRISGPCLSHLSFKVINGSTIGLVAFYRSHYYVARALGNFVGLSQLLGFVSDQTGLQPGPLTCISSYAKIDAPAGLGILKLRSLIV
jgi:hypothetical protein